MGRCEWLNSEPVGLSQRRGIGSVRMERTESEGEGHPTVSPNEGVVVEHGVLPVRLVLRVGEQEDWADFHKGLSRNLTRC